MAELLKRLSCVNAVSGNEDAVRSLIVSEIEAYTDSIEIDTMGNITAFKKGADSRGRIVVTANMDEAGFIISSVTDKGYLKFSPVGVIDPRKLISKRVVIGGAEVKGIIGMKAIHLQTKSERENVVPVSKLFIDIGAKNKAEAEKTVKYGDYVTFDTEFESIGNRVKGKALDRSGACFALIRALKKEYPFDFYACFTAQKEVGARGGKIAAHRLCADAVLTVSSAETEDMFGCEKEPASLKLGGGTGVIMLDKTSIADRTVTEKLLKLAAKEKIRVQRCVLPNGKGDAGAFGTGADGAASVNIAVPCRYSHSPASLMEMSDIDETVKFIELYINKIGELI